MGRLLKRIQKVGGEKKKVSYLISGNVVERMEYLRKKIGFRNKSEFVEKLLEYALDELEKELKKANQEEIKRS